MMKTNFSLRTGIVLAALLCVSAAKAQQDSIAKVSGDVIPVKIIEIGTNAISYTRTDSRSTATLVIDKKDVSYIRLKNGEKQVFMKTVPVQQPMQAQPSGVPNNTISDNNYKTVPSAPAAPTAPSNPMSQGPVSNQYRIDKLNNRYTVNGQEASARDVDRLLMKSTNPAVQATAKTAKAIKITQKVFKFTSIATTTGGGITSIATISQFVTAYQTHQLSAKYYINAGTSLVGTMAFPITSKILKNRRDKLYDKAIDLYNMRN